MEFSEPVAALLKLSAVCLTFAALLRLRLPLWLAISGGGMEMALFSGISPAAWPGLAAGVLTDADFLLLCLMVFLIMLLSGIQDATGQSKKLVTGLEGHLRRPRLRLVLFPALVGLLPMPGGALFSCPMISTAAEGMGLSESRKALVNYWFRHIWEAAWPLYPGYALICALLQIPLTRYCRYTFPLIFLALGVGWLYYLRDVPVSEPARQAAAPPESLCRVLLNALPIAVTLGGAALFGLLGEAFFPNLPGQTAFCLSIALGTATALWQGGGTSLKSLGKLAFNRGTARMLLLLLAIFIFKDTVRRAGLVEAFSHIEADMALILPVFILAPFLSGLLTGIMVGFVGMCFPVLIGLAAASPVLREHMVPLVILATVAGHCGQMLSPLHVCLVVTGEYFNLGLADMWRRLVAPVTLIFAGGALWTLCLFFFDARF
ncbi:MAG: DUF401 family protein [Desulfovibrio sp.]|nr:DUF401 family protein [Desulfovibrio sp.]